MKLLYQSPRIRVAHLDEVDIVTASGTGPDIPWEESGSGSGTDDNHTAPRRNIWSDTDD